MAAGNMRFEFATAGRILFGCGCLGEAAPLARAWGRQALVVTGAHPERAEPLQHLLQAAGMTCTFFPVAGEPTVDHVRQGAAAARAAGAEVVLSFGGGSALDAGKAIAALMTNPGELLDYLEVIGRGQPLTVPPAPFLAIPTTAGTGTEVTRNAVLASPEHRVKVSLRSPLLLARVAVVDPELTRDLPPSLTATTGMDALTQLIEPYVSCRANPLVDALCEEGLRRVGRALRRAFAHGQDLDARTDMALASLFSGMALANAGLGAVHGFAAPLGGSFAAPHGAVCAALLPHVMRINLQAADTRAPQRAVRARYQIVARLLTQNPAAEAEDGIRWVQELCRDLGIPPLRTYGLRPEHFAEISEKAAQASSMKANPLPLTPQERLAILEAAY
ncbi:MAG: iron-containing alcohol dehydrogenase [Verrucomicrobiae bacterium]|nr:iron-containing alcohol dehydrogenase [Verrucomicrobiae bacterium]